MSDLDEPVPYFLTQAGVDAILADRELMTVREAAEVIGMPRKAVCVHARCGFIRGTKIDGFWLLERESVLVLRDERLTGMKRRPSPAPRVQLPGVSGPSTPSARRRKTVCLPAAPLLALVASRGGPTACGAHKASAEARAFFRAQASGRLTERAAEKLAIRLLGLTPWEVWGELT